jgi:hypothetical protein
MKSPSTGLTVRTSRGVRILTGLLLTARGVPILFMGQEFLEDKLWSDDPHRADRLIWWDGLDGGDRHMRDFRHFTRDLLHLRHDQPALRADPVTVYPADERNRLLAFHRWVPGDGRDVVVVASLAEWTFYERSYALGFPLPGHWHEVFNSDLYDHFANPWVAAFLEAAAIAGLTGGALAVVAAAIVVAALAGAVVGFFVGFAVNWFDRLHVQTPSRITLGGCVLCAGKNSGIPPFHDNDWTFNLGGPRLALLDPILAGLDLHEIRTRDAPGGGPAETTIDPATRQPALHCEIGSRIGDYAAVGAAVGSVAGAIAGAVIGGVICAALGLATFGIGAALCLLVIAVAILAGWIADELSDFDERGEAITRGCIMQLTGRWITDSSHQHNEIHDIASAQLFECNDCQDDTTGSTTGPLIAAVGIGRHPTGRDA